LDEVFSCFLDQQRVSAFTQSPTVLSPEPGAPFSLYSGSIVGENVIIERNAKIVQKWRRSDWPEGHFSEVTMNFKATKDGTSLHLIHKGIPKNDIDRIRGEWEEKFWRRMKIMFGWGSLYD
jgi:activator of HSP90 ATPase